MAQLLNHDLPWPWLDFWQQLKLKTLKRVNAFHSCCRNPEVALWPSLFQTSPHTCLHVCFCVSAQESVCVCVCSQEVWARVQGNPTYPIQTSRPWGTKTTFHEKKKTTHTQTQTLTHTVDHRLYQTRPWPALPTGSPTDWHKGIWETGNRKWAMLNRSVKAVLIIRSVKKTTVWGRARQHRPELLLMTTDVNCFNS